MKTAREMFEELGYKLTESDSSLCYEFRKFRIEFDFNFKEYTFYEFDKEYPTLQEVVSVDVKEHKAIHQQLKELGWLDEQ
ncbi:NUDIX hydrolase [Breznakia sp. OttesenSCG-928-G09]|nr:NUDIX hydrolase [Breznakia sp. OttesenSCG-928-G09]